MLCEILQGLGVSFGEPQMLYEGDEYNRDGYFEIKEIRLVYEKLFSESHSSWRSTAPLKEELFGEEKAARADYYAGWMANSIGKSIKETEKLWGFKEPPTPVLLPLAKRAFSLLGRRPVYAVMVRNPMEVAASLKRREGMEEGQALRLYMKYYISILKGTVREEVVFFQKEEFVSGKEQAFKKLDEKIFSGKLSLEGKTAEELEKYVKTDYFHADYGEERVKEYGNALLCELYDYLNRLCGKTVQEQITLSVPEEVCMDNGQLVYEKAIEFERRYEAELGRFAELALQDAYAEAEYRKEQMQSFAGQLSLYRRWLTNKMYGIDCLRAIKERGIKKLGVYGSGEVCSFFLKECAESGIETIYYVKGEERETKCPGEIRKVYLPFVEQTDAVVIAESLGAAELEKAGKLIGGCMKENAVESDIIYLDELLKASYEAEIYYREKEKIKDDRRTDEEVKSEEVSKRRQVLLFKSKSLCYDSTNYFIDCLSGAFEKEGYHAEVLDFEKVGEEGMEEALTEDYDAVFDFNSTLPQALMEDGRHYLDCFHAPFFQILLDHPMYFHAALKEEIQEEHVCCIDKGHVDYVEKYYPNIKKACLMPIPGIYAGEYEKLPLFEDRKMDILLPATYEKPEKYEWEIAQAIPDIQDGIWDIIGQMKKNPNISMEEALEKMLVEQEMECLDRNGKATVFHAHFLADMYINAYYREKAVKELLQSGIKLYVCGQGWEQFEGEGKENLTILPAVDFKEIGGLMQQAKIVLNIAYAFKNGCHDRVLSTMLAGAVSVTSKNPYMESHFGEDELVLYQMNELKKIPDLLQKLLKDEERLKKIARRGYEWAAENGTWQIRAQELIELVDRSRD